MSASSSKPWESIINESVHTSDNHDLGSAHAVSRHFLVVKRGIVHVHYYYIPVNRVEGWDGRVLWLKVTQEEAKHSYERDKTPNSSTYYMGEQPEYVSLPASEFSFPSPLPLIPLKLPISEKEIKFLQVTYHTYIFVHYAMKYCRPKKNFVPCGSDSLEQQHLKTLCISKPNSKNISI